MAMWKEVIKSEVKHDEVNFRMLKLSQVQILNNSEAVQSQEIIEGRGEEAEK